MKKAILFAILGAILSPILITAFNVVAWIIGFGAIVAGSLYVYMMIEEEESD